MSNAERLSLVERLAAIRDLHQRDEEGFCTSCGLVWPCATSTLVIGTFGDDAEKPERQRFTRDDIVGAVAVNAGFGWGRVVRLNVKSVTVVLWGWTTPTRIAFDDVREVAR